jgi:hypothetical protein
MRGKADTSTRGILRNTLEAVVQRREDLSLL